MTCRTPRMADTYKANSAADISPSYDGRISSQRHNLCDDSCNHALCFLVALFVLLFVRAEADKRW